MPELLDYAGTKSRTGLALSTLRRYVSEKRIPYIKIGSRVFFDTVDLEKWIDAHRVPAGSTR